MKVTKLLVIGVGLAALLAAFIVTRPTIPPAFTSIQRTATTPPPSPPKPAETTAVAERVTTSTTPAPARRPTLPNDDAARLYALSPPILQQRGRAQQRIDAFATAAGDFKDVIPAQVKRYQEPEAVLTLVALLRDPHWSPMFSDYIQHRRGLEYTREWLHGVETSLGLDAGFSSVQDAAQLQALLLRAEAPFRQRSDELAAKFQLDDSLAADAREVAMLDTLQTFVKAYRYWAITKNRDE